MKASRLFATVSTWEWAPSILATQSKILKIRKNDPLSRKVCGSQEAVVSQQGLLALSNRIVKDSFKVANGSVVSDHAVEVSTVFGILSYCVEASED